jgi:adenylosuccinate synthase
MVALKYSVMINGVTRLIMTKADVLNNFDTIKVAMEYKINGKTTDILPYELTDDIEPVYKEIKGWKTDINNIRDYNELPRELTNYINFIEQETGVPVTMISVGPKRDEIIIR